MALAKPYAPVSLDDVDDVFPTRVVDLMPEYDQIPAEYRDLNGRTVWNRIVGQWFFRGLPAETEFVPKDGVDTDTALRHLKTVMGSWEPKHEHKEAAVAFLMSEWFSEVRGWEQSAKSGAA